MGGTQLARFQNPFTKHYRDIVKQHKRQFKMILVKLIRQLRMTKNTFFETKWLTSN